MMDNESILNLIVAMARAMGIDPESLADWFNDRDPNQAYYDQLVTYQQALDDKRTEA